MQQFSYHTHTIFSDGNNTLEEMLQQAVKLGWKEIGITDHLIVHKNIRQSAYYDKLVARRHAEIYHSDFQEALPIFQKNAEFFRKTVKKYPLKVYLGYEVDFFTYDGWLEQFKNFMTKVDHDYLISGNHFFMNENGSQVIDIYNYKKMQPEETDDTLENYLLRHYQTLVKAVDSGLFVFLAHLDYARKLPAHAQYPMFAERLAVVDALHRQNMACEISTKGLRKINDYFPENYILRELIKQKVPLVISDDAHSINELGYAFDKAENTLKELGCNNRFHLK